MSVITPQIKPMKPITLNKLLPPKKLATIVESLEGMFPASYSIQDDTGTVLLGDSSKPGWLEFPLAIKDRKLGSVKGGPEVKALASLLNLFLMTEYEKKALATETLDNYNELTLLYRVAKEFSVSMKPEEVARLFVRYARKNIHLDDISLMLLNEKTGFLEVLYAEGDNSLYQLSFQPGRGISGTIFQTEKSEIINDVFQDQRFIQGPVKISSLICTPLKTGQKVIGVINLSTRKPYQYTARDLNLTYTLASQAASALENVKLYEELRQSEKEYRSLYENAIEGIFRCTREHQPLSINPSMCNILGYASPEELIGSIRDIMADHFVEPEKAIELKQILSDHSSVTGFETRVYKKNQTIIWISINASVSKGESDQDCFIDGSIVEITERIKREKAEREKELIQHQSNEYKHLLHVLCHDLANPLANLKGFLTMLQANLSLYDSIQEYMMLSAENGLNIIEFVRKMSALEENKESLSLERHNLKRLVEESGVILYQQLKNKEIQMDNQVDPMHFVRVDKTSFVNSVVNNLLTNAVKFSFPGSTITVKSTLENGKVVLHITDQGIGMPPRILESIFDPSQKTSREGTHGEIGVGFGMPLVKTFITAYGGAISITSTVKTDQTTDHGTQIQIELAAD